MRCARSGTGADGDSAGTKIDFDLSEAGVTRLREVGQKESIEMSFYPRQMVAQRETVRLLERLVKRRVIDGTPLIQEDGRQVSERSRNGLDLRRQLAPLGDEDVIEFVRRANLDLL